MTPNHQKKRRYPFKRNLKRKVRRILFMLVAAALATAVNYYNNNYSNKNDSAEYSAKHSAENNVKNNVEKQTPAKTTSNNFSATQQQAAITKILAAKDNTQAQFWTGLNAKVIKILKDDLVGSRHQKFLISPASNITLLVSHNIDLAPRVPIKKGDTISLRGRYEWNNRGGVIHWTHHDPKGKKEGGWIKANGKIYR